MSENWKRTLIWFFLLNQYPGEVVSRFEEKYLLKANLLNE
jgi:hypothetical protein